MVVVGGSVANRGGVWGLESEPEELESELEPESLELELGLESELESKKCMRDLVWWNLCCVKDLGKRIRWDCSFVIRSRGRWGKCG